MSDATTRAIRLLDLVPYLRAHPGIKLKEIAEEFQISNSELVSDLDLLMVCGLPGYTPLELIDLSTEDGYVTLREPQNLNYPRNFTDSELLILKIALSALSEDSPASLQSEISVLISKLEEQMLGNAPASSIDFVPDAIRNLRRMGDQALAENRKLEISYRNDTKDELSLRKVSLIRQYESEGVFRWDAWCHLAGDRRTFNLDKVVNAKIIEEESEVGDFSGETEPLCIRLRVNANSQFYRKHRNLLKETKDLDHFEIEVYQKEWLIREILTAGGEATVIGPSDLKNLVRIRASQALALYK